jgi:hypothetical protein
MFSKEGRPASLESFADFLTRGPAFTISADP